MVPVAGKGCLTPIWVNDDAQWWKEAAYDLTPDSTWCCEPNLRTDGTLKGSSADRSELISLPSGTK